MISLILTIALYIQVSYIAKISIDKSYVNEFNKGLNVGSKRVIMQTGRLRVNTLIKGK